MTALKKTILVLACIGILTSGYATYLHYKPTDSSFCNFSEEFNCDVVNKSTYAELLGIPVSLIGIAGYLALALLSFAAPTNRNASLLLLIGSLTGLAFSLYLTGIEFFVLSTFCIVCIASQLVILALVVLAIINFKRTTPQLAV